MKIIALILISFTTVSFAKKANDPIVAKVNGKIIKKSTLMRYHTENLNFVSGARKVTVQASLNDLIDRIIGIDKGVKEGTHKKPEVIKKMNDIIYNAQISKDLAPKLKLISVTDEEIFEYYKSNPEYRTSQILLRLKTLPTRDEVASALDRIAGIYTSIVKDPSKFSALAKRHGQTAGAITGGDLGYQPKTRLSVEYYGAIKGKKVGTFTKPFRSQYGFHIVKITGLKTAKQIDKRLYKKIVYDVKRDAILATYFKGQRKASKVEIFTKNL